jgi:hypothetical protein
MQMPQAIEAIKGTMSRFITTLDSSSPKSAAEFLNRSQQQPSEGHQL